MIEKVYRIVPPRVLNKVRTAVHYPLLAMAREIDHDSARTVLVCGEMRSGTSWFGSLVARSVGGREIFEPTTLPFTDFDTLPEPPYGDEFGCDPTLARVCRSILTGRLPKNYFVDRGNRPGFYSARVVKDVRLGWALRYIRHAYPETTVLYIIRHPLGSLLSQVEVAHADQLTISSRYFDLLTRHPSLRRRALGAPIDRGDYRQFKLASWACRQSAVLEWAEADPDIHLVCYEDLMADPSHVMNGVEHRLRNAGFVVRPIVESTLREPSRTTKASAGSRVKSGSGADRWRWAFDANSQAKFTEILAHFGLADLYDDDGEPGPRLQALCDIERSAKIACT